MTKNIRVSWSKISLYRDCPFKWKKVNIDKIYEPKTIFLWRGKVLHACIEKLSNRFLMKNLGSLDEILNKFESNFMRKEFQKALQNRMCIEGIDILTQFYFLIEECDIFQNLHKTEWYFKLPLAKAKNTLLTGIIDRLDLNANKCTLIDYKDGREKKIGEYEDQLKLYQYAVQETYNYDIEALNIHLLKQHKILSRKGFNETEVNDLIVEVYEILENIKNEKFEPKKNQWCKYCSFREICGI